MATFTSIDHPDPWEDCPITKMSTAPRYLTADEITATLKVLRETPDERWTSRGRGGYGLGCRAERLGTLPKPSS